MSSCDSTAKPPGLRETLRLCSGDFVCCNNKISFFSHFTRPLSFFVWLKFIFSHRFQPGLFLIVFSTACRLHGHSCHVANRC